MKKYLKNVKTTFIISILLYSCAGFMSVFLSYVCQVVYDAGASRNMEMFYHSIIITIIFIVMNFSIYLLRGIFRSLYLKTVMFSLNHDVFNSILKYKLNDFLNKNTSDFISFFNNDIKIIERNYFDNLLTIAADLSSFIICTIAIFVYSPTLGSLLLMINIFAIIFPLFFSNRLAKNQTNYLSKFAIFNSKIKDYFSAFELIKHFKIEKKILKLFDQNELENENSLKQFHFTEGIINSISTIISIGITLVILLILIYYVIIGNITLGQMVAINNLTNNVVNPLNRLINEFSTLKSTSGITKNIIEITNNYHQIDDNKQTINFPISTLSLKHLSFAYDKNKPLLQDLNYQFKFGKNYAIVGNSGCGKSTLLKLIMQYYQYQGTITVNDINIKDISLTDLYQQISIVYQNTFIFNDTLKNNITLFQQYDQKVLDDTIKKAGLEKLINSLPKGLDTVISENAKNLSGGEKQRIGIARALLKDSSILLFDECTANLDKQTASDIQNILLSNKNKLSIFITHQLDEKILKKYDEIIAIKDGIIYEAGTFDQLINHKDFFYELFSKTI